MARDDRASFTTWARAHQHRLVRTAYLLCGDQGRAEDLAQEALIKVARQWPKLRDGEPYAYARRILVNDNISWWRRRRPDVVLSDVPELSAAGPDNSVHRRLALTDALAQLAPKQRAVLVLRYYEDLTEAQTAQALGISVGTVKSQAHDALRRLRETSPELAEFIGGK
ncbi:MAG: SigE family RNA polymerase sigma factor [Jatrophihabitans sp.]